MKRNLSTFQLLLLLLFACHLLHAQTPAIDIDKWVTDLSVRKDLRSEKYRAILATIEPLDSSQYCILIKQLRQSGAEDNPYFRIRMIMMENVLRLSKSACIGSTTILERLKDALQAGYELEDDALLYDLHQAMASYYLARSEFGQATLHSLMAIELANKLGKEQVYFDAGNWYGLGYALFHSREYQASISATYKALTADEQLVGPDTLVTFYRMNAWNNIGLAYEKLGQADSAFYAFNRASEIARQHESGFWNGVIAGNKGDMYFQQGRYDSATVLLTEDYTQSMLHKQYFNAANSLQWLARIDIFQGQPLEALKKLREVMQLLAGETQPTYLANALYAFTQVFAELDQADSVNHYMQAYLVLHDSIEKAAFNNRAEIVQMQMQNNEAVHKIKALNREKKKIAMVRNLFIVIILLTTAFGYLVYNRSRLKMRLAQQRAHEEKRMAAIEIEAARAQLSIFTQHLREKSSLVESLQDQLMSREQSEEHRQLLDELSRHTILTEDDWEKFKRIFEKVHPGFFQVLRQNSEDITIAELRMAALCKLQLSVRECSQLLGISINSVHKNRQRLRHRLGLDPEANLELHFS